MIASLYGAVLAYADVIVCADMTPRLPASRSRTHPLIRRVLAAGTTAGAFIHQDLTHGVHGAEPGARRDEMDAHIPLAAPPRQLPRRVNGLVPPAGPPWDQAAPAIHAAHSGKEPGLRWDFRSAAPLEHMGAYRQTTAKADAP